MTSIPSYVKQVPTDARNFIAVSSLFGITYGLNEATGALTPAPWAVSPAVYAGGLSIGTPGASSLTVGGKLRDMGKTFVSSGRTFRKVQAIVPVPTTFGIGGAAAQAAPTSEYYTGYIELGWEGFGSPAPVARAP